MSYADLQDDDGEGAKELEELKCDRMNVLQLDVRSEEQVTKAVEYVQEGLGDKATGIYISDNCNAYAVYYSELGC
jgi:hypothetical protein